MIYTVTNIQQKTSAKGTNYQTADLMDANGQVTEGVSTFNGEFKQEGMSIEGHIETKDVGGKTYYNFKAQSSTRPQGAAKTAQMEKVMEKKANLIEDAQERKNDAIAHAGAITNATNLVTAILGGQMRTIGAPGSSYKFPSEEEIKNRVREYIIWYKNLYLHPEAVNPAAGEPTGDIPF